MISFLIYYLVCKLFLYYSPTCLSFLFILHLDGRALTARGLIAPACFPARAPVWEQAAAHLCAAFLENAVQRRLLLQRDAREALCAQQAAVAQLLLRDLGRAVRALLGRDDPVPIARNSTNNRGWGAW